MCSMPFMRQMVYPTNIMVCISASGRAHYQLTYSGLTSYGLFNIKGTRDVGKVISVNVKM